MRTFHHPTMNMLIMAGSLLLAPVQLMAAPVTTEVTIRYIEPTTSEGSTTTTFIAAHSNKCIDVGLDGIGIVQNTCNGSLSQSWIPIDRGGNVYTLTPKSHPGQCLDLNGPQFTNGTLLALASCESTQQTQQWIRDPSPGHIIANGGAQPLMCWDVQGGSMDDGAIVGIWACQPGIPHFVMSWQSLSLPLDDLAGTRIYYDLVGDGLKVDSIEVPATALTGGGVIEQVIQIMIPDELLNYIAEFQVTAYDLLGNESEKSPKISHSFITTDTIAPETPTNVTVNNPGG